MLDEGLWPVGSSGQVARQVAYSSNLGRLLSLGRNQVEEPTRARVMLKASLSAVISTRAFELISAALSDRTHLPGIVLEA